jgi:DNA-binding GntR family transcriptional regulator
MGLLGKDGAIAVARSASDIATELIREAIFEGRLDPGQRLKEEELAQELGISRTPVREALLILQAEGLVSAVPNRGAVVRTYTENDLVDMYELRALLESFAAHQAAKRITDEQLAALADSCERFKELRQTHDLFGLIKENLFFHQTIVEAAGTTKLADLVRSAVELPLVYRSFFWFTEQETEISERSHRKLLATLRAGDSERAELLMKEHIYEGRDFLISRFRSGAVSKRAGGAGGRSGNHGAGRKPGKRGSRAAAPPSGGAAGDGR